MNVVEHVFEIAESFMECPRDVVINDWQINSISKQLKNSQKPKFPTPEINNPLVGCILELTAASINYCYWYGKHNIRPGGSSSTLMYELMLESFNDFEPCLYDFNRCINKFKETLALNRFPLLEKRCQHLDELVQNDAVDYCSKIINDHESIMPHLNELIRLFPGFASDIFLKRASLFFIQLFRRFGWFNHDLHKLHVPADYQVPKMLEHFGCFSYSPELYNKIENGQLILKTSWEECEIRSATILAIKQLCINTGWNVAEVDAFFFLKRRETQRPFHLTITTDY
jgi:hypothetical protein